MRILLVTAYFRPHIGGIERFVENLASGLARRDHEVTVLCCRTDRASPRREEVDGYRIERVPAISAIERRLGVPYPLPEPVALLGGLRRSLGRADVAHVQDSIYATSAPALFLARRHDVPSVLTQHVSFVPQRNRWLDAAERAAIATLGRVSRLADVVTTVNSDVAVWATDTWGVRDVRHLPVGVPDPSPASADRGEVRDSFGLPRDRFVALFVGRDVYTKGLDTFLAAHGDAYELVAVTDRPPGDSRALVLPFMDHSRLQTLLGCVDAFVLSSTRDSMPVALQEALASGLPVITTRQPGFDRYLSDEDVIYIAPEPEAIRQALLTLTADPELRSRLSARALAAAARHFGLDAFVRAYEEVYEEARAARSG